MEKIFSLGKWIVVAFFAAVAFFGWKSGKLDAVEARQATFEGNQNRFSVRMDGYDRELEKVRVESKLNNALLEDGKKRLIRIEHLLLDRK